jgi:hypothetical protein
LVFIAIYNEHASLHLTLGGEALLLIAGFVLRRMIDPQFTGASATNVDSVAELR